MSTPITISLYYKGRQKDYEAILTSNQTTCVFKVYIDDAVINFEGSVDKAFQLKKEVPAKSLPQTDESMLEAVREQLNQIFY